MKKFLASMGIGALLFTSCGGSSAEDDNTENSSTPRYITYKTSDFTIDVPDTWDTINEFTKEYPDEIRIAFKNNLKDSDFTANVTVMREQNPNELTSADFSQEKLQNHSNHLLDYKLLSQEELTLTVAGADSKTWLNTFSGKNTSSGQTLNFMQVVLCKADRAWTVTASYQPKEDDFTVEKMAEMLNSFAVR